MLHMYVPFRVVAVLVATTAAVVCWCSKRRNRERETDRRGFESAGLSTIYNLPSSPNDGGFPATPASSSMRRVRSSARRRTVGHTVATSAPPGAAPYLSCSTRAADTPKRPCTTSKASPAMGRSRTQTSSRTVREQLYGTTFEGGHGPCVELFHGPIGCGTVFKLTPSPSGYTETVLHSFGGPPVVIGASSLSRLDRRRLRCALRHDV